MMAWFWMSPVIDAFTLTSNAIVADALMAIAPPVVPFAPTPSRTRTVREAAMYSP
jgi:hypothetical protein